MITIKYDDFTDRINIDDYVEINIEEKSDMARDIGKMVSCDDYECWIEDVPEFNFEFTEEELIRFSISRLQDVICNLGLRLTVLQQESIMGLLKSPKK